MSAEAVTAPVTLWHNRRFRSFWAAQTVSQFGDRITELALPLIAVTALHASAWQVSWLTALVWAPNLLALWIGSWVDRLTRQRRVLVAADLVRALVLLTVPVAHLAGAVTLGQLYVVVLLAGVGGTLFNTAYPAFYVRLVRPEFYVEAGSKLGASQSVSNVAGPALAGVLVQALTAPVAVAVDAMSFVASAVLVGRIPTAAAPPAADTGESLRSRAGVGLRRVLHDPVLAASLGASATINFCTFLAGSGLVVLFASRTLGLGPATIGLAFGVGSTGALLGAVVAPRLSRRIGVGRSIVVGAVLFPAPLALVAAAGGPAWLAAAVLATAEFLSGVGVMLFDVNLNALKTSVIADGVRARVAGAYSSINYGVRPVGAVVGGALATGLGIRTTLLIAAGGGALSVLWLLRSPIPAIARIDGQ